MKTLALVGMLLSSVAFGNHRGHEEDYLAQDLVQALEQLSNAASREAYRGGGEWYEISNIASDLAQSVNYQIVYPLYQGQDPRYLTRALNNLKSQLRVLNYELNACGSLPYNIQRLQRQVNQLFAQLERALQECRDGGGGGGGGDPGFGNWVCNAVDAGWEEHGGNSHLGYGRSQWEAQQNAIYECQRHHGRCRLDFCSNR
jgi:hypothetical protein